MTKRARKPPVITTTLDTLVRLTQPEPKLTDHNTVRHAAHSMTGPGGHDLERWVVQFPTQPTGEQLAALGVAPDAKYHCGYLERGTGRQHWVYTAIRPLSSGSCERCGAAASTELFARRGLS